MLTNFISQMPFTILAGVFFAVMLFLKISMHKAFIENKILKRSIMGISLLFFMGGLISLIILLIRGSAWFMFDLVIASLILGIALTGLVAETSQDPNDSVL